MQTETLPFCEVRISSHQRPTYAQDAHKLLLTLQSIYPVQRLQVFPLTRSKVKLFEERNTKGTDVRYTHSILRNSRGGVISAAGGNEDADLFADAGMVSSLDQFVKHDGYCDQSNLWFKTGTKPNGEAKWTHVLLAGNDNEFALTGECTMREYEYVLGRLRTSAG